MLACKIHCECPLNYLICCAECDKAKTICSDVHCLNSPDKCKLSEQDNTYHSEEDKK